MSWPRFCPSCRKVQLSSRNILFYLKLRELFFLPFTKLNLLFKGKKKKKKARSLLLCSSNVWGNTQKMPGTYGIFMWLIFFPCLRVCTESLLFGTQQKKVSCAQHDLVWPIKWKWISSLHIKFCWIPFAQESKIAVSCSSMLMHFLSDSHISLFPQILKSLLAATLQIPHPHKWALQTQLSLWAQRCQLGARHWVSPPLAPYTKHYITSETLIPSQNVRASNYC